MDFFRIWKTKKMHDDVVMLFRDVFSIEFHTIEVLILKEDVMHQDRLRENSNRPCNFCLK